MQIAHQFNAQDFLNFAAAKHPNIVKKIVMGTAPARSRGMGDASTDTGALPDLSYLNTTAADTTISIPVTPVSFDASGTTSTPVIASSNSGTPSADTGTISSIISSLTSAVPNLLTAYTANKQLTACTQTNQQRLSQGLPAVDCSSFAPTAQVGLTSSTSSLLFLLGGGALLFLFMGMAAKNKG
ncbi:MAG: hypothetical protein ACYDHF_07985 [Candidatus Cryosericum sp.]